MKKLELKLMRVKLTSTYTEGKLINLNTNEVIFDTLEDRVRDINADGDLDDDGEGKVYGETAIPYGEYELEVTYSPKFKKDMVLLKDVPYFTGIRMHWGGTKDNTYGCILGGKKDRNGHLANIGFTDTMVELVRKYDKATIKIV